jgi:subtilisin-like proprotein convertase family protein
MMKCALALSSLLCFGPAALAQVAGATEVNTDKAIENARLKEPGSIHEARARVDAVYRQTRSPASDVGRVIYGADDRIEVWQETDPILRQMAEAACVVIFPSEVINNGDGTYTLVTEPWFSQGGTLCADEPFRGQPQIGFCSGFLVGTDLITTAGHCVGPSGVVSATNAAFVFNFEIDTMGGSAPVVVPASDVYFGSTQVSYALGSGLDHSVVRVDRPVTGRNPVPIRRDGVVSNGDPLAVIGHPVVLPKKIAGGAEVKDNNGTSGWFDSNLDTYGGNSGSMVVNLNTYEVEGILVRGLQDFTSVGGCVRSNVVSDNNGSYEECSKTTAFASAVPPLGMQVSPAGNVTHIGLVGGPFTPGSTLYTLSNPTGDPVDYTVSLTSPSGNVLIDGGLSPIGGTLPPGGSALVNVSLAGSTSGLAAGVYNDTVSFTDIPNARTVDVVHTIEVGQTLVSVSAGTVNGSGPVGGPFSGGASFTVTSQRPTPVTVQVSASEPWVSLNGGTGPVNVNLSGNGDSDSVMVGIDSSANALAAGLYTADVTFLNTTSGAFETRAVVLDVGRYVYNASGLPVPITDNNTILSTINVSDAYCIGDVDLSLNISHTFIGDLIVELTSPEGTTVRLHNRTGGSADDIVRTYDQGTVNPDGPGTLDDFNGEIATGTWTLAVSDNASLDTGTLNAWSLRLATSGPVCPPVASGGSVTVLPGATTLYDLEAVSGVGNPLTYTILSLPSIGALWDASTETGILSVPYQISSGNQVIIRTPYGATGDTSFTFRANDGLDSNVASVTISVANAGTVASFPMDSNPGWTTEGQWAFGTPTGAGSNGGDPTSGYTGSSVYGYNLSGDYPNNMASTLYLTTTPIDASNATDVKLGFWRRLGIESSTYDKASLQYSTNGTTWTTIWSHTGSSFNELAWTYQQYDLPAAAGASTLYVRWGMGTTDSSVTYPGWNIDDVVILGNLPAPCAADFNFDGVADILDFLDFFEAFSIEAPAADYNADGIVDILDLLDFLNEFSAGC